MSVASLLKGKGSEIISLKAENTIAEAVALLSSKKIGAALVLADDGSLAGILSERDVIRGLGEKGADIMSQSVNSLMTSKVETCSPNDSVESLMKRMTEGRFRHVPVEDENGVCGVISIGDVVKSRMAELEHEADAMRSYIAGG